MPEFSGVRALVTGGGSGIGLATSLMLVARGAVVAVLDRELSALPSSCQGFSCDVTDDAAVRRAVEDAARSMGGIDVVVTSAGVGAVGDIATNDDAEWQRVLDTNVLGVVRICRAALPWLRASPSAAVVHVGSVAAWTGLPQRAVYSASKGAVQALTLAMAADHLADGIRVNCVNPGTVDSPWVARLLEGADDPVAARRALEDRQPHGRLVTTDEVAAAICYLSSPAAGSTTGTVLAVDGGMHGVQRPRVQGPHG